MAKKGFVSSGALIAILVFIAVAGGGTYLYVSLEKNRLSPEEVIQKMFESISQISSLRYDASLKGTLTEKENSNTRNIQLNVSGYTDTTNANSLDGDYRIAFQTSGLGFDMDAKYAHGTMFIRLRQAPALGFFDFAPLEGIWIQLQTKELTSSSPGFTFLAGGEEIEHAQAILAPLRERLKEARFLRVEKVFEDGVIGGQDMYHYAFSLAREELKQFFIDAARIIAEELTNDPRYKDREFPLDEYKNSITERIDEAFGENEFLRLGELWMGKKDFLPYRILTEVESVPHEKNFTVIWVFDVMLSNFNQPIIVEAPPESIRFEEALKMLFGNLGGVLEFAPAP